MWRGTGRKNLWIKKSLPTYMHVLLSLLYCNSTEKVYWFDTNKFRYVRLQNLLFLLFKLKIRLTINNNSDETMFGGLEHCFAASTDLTLPVDTTIIIGIFKIHRTAEIYPNPELFDPDRFLPDQSSNRHYYSFIPFSAGPRSCVGKWSNALLFKQINNEVTHVSAGFKIYKSTRKIILAQRFRKISKDISFHNILF